MCILVLQQIKPNHKHFIDKCSQNATFAWGLNKNFTHLDKNVGIQAGIMLKNHISLGKVKKQKGRQNGNFLSFVRVIKTLKVVPLFLD